MKVTVKIVTTRQPVTQGEWNNLQCLKRLMFTLDLPQNFFAGEHEGSRAVHLQRNWFKPHNSSETLKLSFQVNLDRIFLLKPTAIPPFNVVLMEQTHRVRCYLTRETTTKHVITRSYHIHICSRFNRASIRQQQHRIGKIFTKRERKKKNPKRSRISIIFQHAYRHLHLIRRGIKSGSFRSQCNRSYKEKPR